MAIQTYMRGNRLWTLLAILTIGMQTLASTGGPCQKNADCGFGFSCIKEYQGGYCVKFDCSARNPCDEGAQCVDIEGEGFSVCLKTCMAQSDCRAGYRCYEEGVCLP